MKKRSLVAKPLKNYLYYRQTCDHFIDVRISRPSCRPVSSGLASRWCLIASHFGEVTLPKPRASQFQYLPCLHTAHKVLERTFDNARVGFFSRKPGRFFQKIFTKHKICTFHV